MTQDVVHIQKLNETYIRVWSDNSGIEQELHERYKFEVQGYQHMPAYKSGKWDGLVRLYNLQTKRLYFGLHNNLRSFIDEMGYKIDYHDDGTDSFGIDSRWTKEYVLDWLNNQILSTNGEQISLRDYQVKSILRGILLKRILIVSPTSSGKTLQLYCVLKFLHEHIENFSCMILVPSTGLLEQMMSDFIEYSYLNNWNIKELSQKVSGDYIKEITKDIVISTWQSQYKQTVEHFNQFDAIFCDEAHEYKANVVSSILEKSTQVQYKIGFTGTLDGKHVNELTLTGLFGDPYKVITTRELMDSGSVSDLKIKCIILDHPEEIKKSIRTMMNKKTFDYQTEIDYIVTNEKRNRFIANLALSLKGNTLILFNLVEKQGKEILDLLKDKDKDKTIYYIDGGVKASKREEYRKTIVSEETDCILLCSYGTTSRGYSVSNIDNIIFASPTKSKIRNLQSIGRGLRLFDGKQYCTLYDISDDLTIKSKSGIQRKQNFTLRHFLDRISIYESEQFSYKMIRIQL